MTMLARTATLLRVAALSVSLVAPAAFAADAPADSAPADKSQQAQALPQKDQSDRTVAPQNGQAKKTIVHPLNFLGPT